MVPLGTVELNETIEPLGTLEKFGTVALTGLTVEQLLEYSFNYLNQYEQQIQIQGTKQKIKAEDLNTVILKLQNLVKNKLNLGIVEDYLVIVAG